MADFTKEIITPVGKHKVVFKTMLSVAEREQVDTAQMKFVQTKDGKDFSVTDTAKVTLAQKHELLKVAVTSIDDDPINCFDRIQKMYDADGAFIHDSIIEEQKKMTDSISPV